MPCVPLCFPRHCAAPDATLQDVFLVFAGLQAAGRKGESGKSCQGQDQLGCFDMLGHIAKTRDLTVQAVARRWSIWDRTL